MAASAGSIGSEARSTGPAERTAAAPGVQVERAGGYKPMQQKGLRWALGIGGISLALMGSLASAAQQWLGEGDRDLVTDGVVRGFDLPHPGSGPTTITVARDG